VDGEIAISAVSRRFLNVSERENTEGRLDGELTRVDCRHFINGGLLNTSCGPVEPLKFIGRC
jgi:hypothetical protein